ncbi:type VI secretion system lipoprotein TssJ [Zoogloea sp.]|uniref:type VI secretion system lipoprotein TssJ n=1 Tax=Zoogloea sp. TaxID=49181 RepID=UPI0035B4B2AA
MIRLTQALGATTTVVAALALAGCAKPLVIFPPKPEPSPTVIRLDITADAAVNADRHGRAMPIVVRFYLLQTTAAFDNADFFSLFERDDAVLGAAKVVREEITLIPNQAFSTELHPQGSSRFLAVFAAYREVNTVRWRATAPIPQHATTAYSIQISQSGISIAPKPPRQRGVGQ